MRRPAAPPVWAVAPLLVWLPALATMWWNPQDAGRLVVLLELLVWLAAVGAGILAAAHFFRLPLAAVVAVGAAATAAAVWGANWSGLENRTYFALHRPAFAHVGSQIREGALGERPTGALPVLLHPLSADGARVVGRDGDRPLVLLPQQSAAGAGYVYFDGDPSGRVMADLGDGQVRLVDGLYLGGGWWWL